MREIIKIIEEIIEDKLKDAGLEVCDECNKIMTDGFIIRDGSSHYCKEECLLKNMTKEEYLELYDCGAGDSYYTEWEEYDKNILKVIELLIDIRPEVKYRM